MHRVRAGSEFPSSAWSLLAALGVQPGAARQVGLLLAVTGSGMHERATAGQRGKLHEDVLGARLIELVGHHLRGLRGRQPLDSVDLLVFSMNVPSIHFAAK